MSRMYDPVIARFLQEDTYRGELNDPLSLNLYTYTHNNPITYDDPDGHWIHIAIGAAIGAAINVGITAYLDYKDDHKFNSGWREYAGAAVEGAITGSIGAATGGASLFTMITAEVASGFVGSAARQYISKGKVSLKKSATDAAFNGIGFIGGHYAGKALSPVKKAIAQSKVVTKTKGLVLDGLSSKSDTILSLNKKIGESVQNVFEKINFPTQNKLAFSSAGGGGRSGIEATFDYVDESVMKNFNKVTSSETLQSTVKNIDNNISSSIKGTGNLKPVIDPSRLLEAPKEVADHHLIPAFRGKSKPYADFIKVRGINVDDYTITVSSGKGGQHMNFIHGKGQWNKKWMDFIDNNPNATAKDIYQFTGKMMDDYGLNGYQIHPYKK